jgi:diadenosine tetraphosphate (Ap4A) HIT family hydrolase
MPDRDPACIFCRIVAGEIPASFVHRDHTVSAFLDVRPVTPGHLLVVPDRHHALLADVPDPTWAAVTLVARRLSGALRASELGVAGVNLYLADGETAGQEVPHVHVHVIPRREGDGFRIATGAVSAPAPERDELDRQAEAIRLAIGDRP